MGEEGTPTGSRHSGFLSDDWPQSRHHSGWEGQCSCSDISMGTVGEGLGWVGITDLCPFGSPAAQSPTAADPLQQAYAGVQQYAGR